MRLNDKVAFISGSTRGIGRTIAEVFAREGAKVVVSGRSVDKGEKVASRIREAGGEATFVDLDVSDEASVEEAIATTIDCYGTLTTLINNAAPTDLVSAGFKPMHEVTTDEWDAILRATLTGNVFWASKCAGQSAPRRRPQEAARSSTSRQAVRRSVSRESRSTAHPRAA